MTTLVTHPLIPYTIGKVWGLPTRVIACGVFVSLIPDADVLLEAMVPGLPHAYAHRGATHSVAFAMLMALLMLPVATGRDRVSSGERWRVWTYLAVCGTSHGVLDAITHFGDGVAFFWPFLDGRYLFQFQPLQASPFIDNFFSLWGLRVLLAEFQWVWIPCLLILALNAYVLRARKRTSIGVGE